MNTITTVGDLVKALSVYDSSLRLNVRVVTSVGEETARLNNDTLIYRVGDSSEKTLCVSVVMDDSKHQRDRKFRVRMHKMLCSEEVCVFDGSDEHQEAWPMSVTR